MHRLKKRRLETLSALIFPIIFAGCSNSEPSKDPAEINAVLDAWHQAASDADEAAYIHHMTADGVFLGTDATERWSTAEFQKFVHPYFSKGTGWTYKPKNRHVVFSNDGKTAWFDERLFNDKYGELRGTGVLIHTDNEWKIAHYNMSFPLPNDLTKQIVEIIKNGKLSGFSNVSTQ